MILVIGYGNSLCGDDGLGPYVIDQLEKSLEGSLHAIEFLSLHQLTPELAETISHADSVIFVDASAGLTPGTITCHEIIPSIQSSEAIAGAFTHHLNPIILLENANLLYGNSPETYLYTVTGENFQLGDSFSSTVEAALPTLMEQLKMRLSQCMNLA